MLKLILKDNKESIFEFSISNCHQMLPKYPSGRQKIMFCAIKSVLFSGSCSRFERFSLKTGHIFLPSLKTLSSKIKIPFIYPTLKIVGSDKHVK